MTGSFSIFSSLFIDGMCVVALALATKVEWGYIPPSCYEVVDEPQKGHFTILCVNTCVKGVIK